MKEALLGPGGMWRAILAGLLTLGALGPTSIALANGGTLQVSETVGPYQVSVYSSPSPPRVGLADVSVLVQRAETDEVVDDAQVEITAAPVGHAGSGGTYPATRGQATNRLYYAAHIPLGSEGRWRFEVMVAGPEGSGQVGFEAQVGQAGLLDSTLVWVVLALLPVAMVALLIWRGGRKPRGERRAVGRRREPR